MQRCSGWECDLRVGNSGGASGAATQGAGATVCSDLSSFECAPVAGMREWDSGGRRLACRLVVEDAKLRRLGQRPSSFGAARLHAASNKHQIKPCACVAGNPLCVAPMPLIRSARACGTGSEIEQQQCDCANEAAMAAAERCTSSEVCRTRMRRHPHARKRTQRAEKRVREREGEGNAEMKRG